MALLRTAIIIVVGYFGSSFAFAAIFASAALFIAPIAILAVFILVAAPFALRRTAFFLTAADVGKYAEIMVGKLEIIFGLHAVAIMLRVLRLLFEFLQHLRSVAARPIVDPILVIIPVAVVALRTVAVVIIAPAATALGLAHIHRD